MRARFIFETDMAASIEANIEFIDKCIRDLQKRKKKLLTLEEEASLKRKTRQIDIEEIIEEEQLKNKKNQ